MCPLVVLDGLELFSGNTGSGESSSVEVGLAELLQGLVVKGRFELFQDVGEL